ncbi:D-hexose-6-phosphate mutarotase [Phycicoccus sonneratiae]|uniref:Putative glucose-6-phosphate 1-epimerase n=1 Tax=Phycicoccus sonneratiae TaxID=2807628 RepID=A0ABS2CR23_9MICO|nr:D-hexose-6-phosphate mutarotase [Phycicoccus sonneraticus]MBM6402333.1 D-hexose-6-phosphate mutarotase [Phycicoccus sonneraticus]
MSAPGPLAREVDTDRCTGTVLDEGGLVLAWAPTGHAPVLFAHPGVPVRSGTPPHAGIPVCWPWFGPGRGGGMTPSHGFARSSTWQFLGEDEGPDSRVLRHRLTPDDASHPDWSQAYHLDLVTRFGTTLEVTLSTTNTGDEPFVVEEALHAYLAVGDVRRVVVGGLDGTPFHDKVLGEDLVQEGDLVLTGETDRVYRSSADVVVTDPVLGRRLTVSTTGAADRVVWNPWSEKAIGLDDIGDQWPHLLCVEAANVLDDVVTVDPGQTRWMTYRLSVEDL